MGRPFIFKSNSQEASSGESQNAGRAHRAELVQECVRSALITLDLLQSLADNIGLCRASYTEFSSCRAALLVILAESVSSGRSQMLQDGLDHGMTLIRQMVGSTSSESEISYIESIETAIRQLSSKDNTTFPESIEEPHSATTAYAKFKDWTQSMKRDKNVMHSMELSSFSPVSHLTSGTDNAFHDLNYILEPNWSASDLELVPESFLN